MSLDERPPIVQAMARLQPTLQSPAQATNRGQNARALANSGFYRQLNSRAVEVLPPLQPVQLRKRGALRHQRARKERPRDDLVLAPSKDCVVGFQRVADLQHALRAARRQRLTIQYIHRDGNGVPMHAVVEWKGKPVILTDCYDGSEIH